MNKLEKAYSERLALLQGTGHILGFAYEAIKLRLADKTFFTPDFIVYAQDGTVEFHEVKGFWEDDARVKIKVAATQYPFRVLAVTRVKGEWQFEDLTQ